MTHEWVSVEEAARRLGCSVSTVRRRIEAGELVGEREVIGGSKERYRVRMPHDASQPESPDESPDASPAPESTLTVAEGLLALVREMRQQGTTDAERIAGLMRQLGAAEATTRLLVEQRDDFARWLAESRAEVERLRTKPWWKRLW